MLDESNLTEIKQSLTKRKTELSEKIKRDKIRASEEEYSTELSDYDNHPGDQGTELFEREKDLAITAHESAELSEIEKALERIEQNNYGTCSVCGKEIDMDRLIAIPETEFCYEHADEKQNFEVEERQSMGSLEFDDTNSWNTLEGYGSSASPSDFTRDQEDYNQLTENPDTEDVEDMDRFTNKDKINE
ncbi:TraR/DksA C4-type zinc finger protein [Amphibacillus sp. MSJ-3]|uniref:TraR/DksA C4-type zinc finger protein n=1 Tax=Amphibacillus sp. MSJ-3 TaxID=2841505 RepID=UPI001C0EC923|nr:TraR/DksA C4-type zinc finger protein [Amphibacillus sp. MSJ-3]MBU5594761.1 TraR/DksA C4-type zinc finger protein [Amphibacillus sp. MSJ-3]